MSTPIELPEALFKRLQRYAVPFVDTPVSVIERIVDFYEARNGETSDSATVSVHRSQSVDSIKKYDPMRPPDLFHTTVFGEFGGTKFSKWNDLLKIAHLQAFKKAESFEELKRVTHAQIKMGEHTTSGYRPLPEIGISLQGADANHSWVRALRLAQYLQVPLTAEVEWRHNDGAAFPGQRGVLSWKP
ncbi:MAG: hypothetical protein EOP84_01770 [Verrucomicrobiaceae bacterium]|nr:MAG: hypothetical protein EOP84_01770 [Verrucomicrobiaceae bacterium]